ncbi:MAG: hypothetical protein NVSMB38_31320 [Ktedonobacteraceae bacterium]
METNEPLRSVLLKRAESSMEHLVLSLQAVAEGDLQELEQQVMLQMLELGRACLEHILSQQAKSKGPIRQREEECGHTQRLVSIRPSEQNHGPLLDGERGLSTVTHLDRRGTVLLRYVTGVLNAISNETCPHCGRQGPAL